MSNSRKRFFSVFRTSRITILSNGCPRSWKGKWIWSYRFIEYTSWCEIVVKWNKSVGAWHLNWGLISDYSSALFQRKFLHVLILHSLMKKHHPPRNRRGYNQLLTIHLILTPGWAPYQGMNSPVIFCFLWFSSCPGHAKTKDIWCTG